MHDTSYPVKLVSRTVAKKRAGKMRFSWFVVGTAFGIGSAFFFSSNDSAVMASLPPLDAPLAPVAELVATPEALSPAAVLNAPAQEVVLSGASDEESLPPASEEKLETMAAGYPRTLDLKAENGDTLISMLTKVGVPAEEAYGALQAMGKTYDPKKLDIGQSLKVTLDKSGEPSDGKPHIKYLMIPVSLTTTLELSRKPNNDFSVKTVDVPVERKLVRAGGRIDSSLYETGADANIPVSLLSEIITAYSYDVDFQRDIRSGDAIDVMYERMETKDGAVAGYGNIIFAQLDLSGQEMKIYRYEDKNGNADYYNIKGESIRKALLRTPINGAKITSRFGMRNHPILGYSKMHRGVDFGAPTGTPIYAAGDGTVDHAGRKGGYGNYLRIRHTAKYASAYGHISRFAPGIVPGKKVKQGQVVAYVGSTGQSTGPHLHYEILVGGQQVNPSNVKFKTGAVLAGKELASFRRSIEKIEATRQTMPRSNRLAMADTGKKKSTN